MTYSSEHYLKQITIEFSNFGRINFSDEGDHFIIMTAEGGYLQQVPRHERHDDVKAVQTHVSSRYHGLLRLVVGGNWRKVDKVLELNAIYIYIRIVAISVHAKHVQWCNITYSWKLILENSLILTRVSIVLKKHAPSNHVRVDKVLELNAIYLYMRIVDISVHAKRVQLCNITYS